MEPPVKSHTSAVPVSKDVNNKAFLNVRARARIFWSLANVMNQPSLAFNAEISVLSVVPVAVWIMFDDASYKSLMVNALGVVVGAPLVTGSECH